jgi:hypothetical protein
MDDTLEVLQKTYRRFFALGMFFLLTAFLTLIWKPFGGTTSLAIALVLFLVALIPLELARRVARKMALLAMRPDRKA